jgi:hypothetical protein
VPKACLRADDRATTSCYALSKMRRLFIGLVLIFVASQVRSLERFSARNLVFLTRDGCVNTARMRSSLDEALKALALPTNYALINVDRLESSDRRRGYGTPTVLYNGHDLFGMAAPPAPTRRLDGFIGAEFRPQKL